MCNKKPVPQLLTVTDKDGPGFAAPYSVSLHSMSKTNWTARMNDNSMYTIYIYMKLSYSFGKFHPIKLPFQGETNDYLNTFANSNYTRFFENYFDLFFIMGAKDI